MNEHIKKTLNGLLEHTIDKTGTELHIAPGASPLIRVNGKMQKIDIPPIEQNEMKDILNDPNLLGDKDKRTQVHQSHSHVFSFAVNGLGRFRGSVFTQRGTLALTVRVLPYTLPTLEKLELPSQINDLVGLKKGLVFVAGGKGSGKSATLAAMVDFLNSSRTSHISTIENPIEFLHSHKSSIVTQREIGTDVQDFENAMRSIKTEGADTVMIGEIQSDKESIMLAVSAAEEKLILAGLKTRGGTENILDYFQKILGDNSSSNLKRLANALKGVIHQRETNGKITAKITLDPLNAQI